MEEPFVGQIWQQNTGQFTDTVKSWHMQCYDSHKGHGWCHMLYGSNSLRYLASEWQTLTFLESQRHLEGLLHVNQVLVRLRACNAASTNLIHIPIHLEGFSRLLW